MGFDMDSLAKKWHQHLTHHAYTAASIPISSSGWSLWMNNAKFSSFSQKKIEQEIATSLRHIGPNPISLVPPLTTLIGRLAATTNGPHLSLAVSG